MLLNQTLYNLTLCMVVPTALAGFATTANASDKSESAAKNPPHRHYFPSPSEKRVKEIASWLTAEPKGLGFSVSDRQIWESLAETPDARGIIRSAEQLIDEDPPELPDELYLLFTETGNRDKYQAPYGRRVWRVGVLMLAECLEYKGRFLAALERDIMAICEERSWVMPAHDAALDNFNHKALTIDLGSSARGWLLAQVDYWLGDKIDARVRERLRSEVHRRILDLYFAALEQNSLNGNWWMLTDNNWSAVCTAGVVGCAMALLDSPEKKAEILAAMEISNKRFISGFTKDGYCSEGMGYWNYGFGTYVVMGLIVKNATDGKLDIFEGEKLNKIAKYALAYQIQPGCSPFFADGGGAPSHEVWTLMKDVYPDAVPADFTGVPVLRTRRVAVGLRDVSTVATAKQDKEKAHLPLRSFFDQAQVLITRSKISDEVPFGAAIKGGHNSEHHNHNDLGSYTIVLDGVEITGDPGGEIYTRRTFSSQRYVSNMLNSYGHPVPVVSGQLQKLGRDAAAVVVATDFTDSTDMIDLELKAAYPVPELKSLRRKYTHDREKRVITISDTVSFSSPQTFSTPLVTYLDVKREGDDVIYLHGNGKCVMVQLEAEGGKWQLEEEEIENPGRPSPKRLAVTFDKPVSEASVCFTFKEATLP
jgi:hypothetical protein